VTEASADYPSLSGELGSGRHSDLFPVEEKEALDIFGKFPLKEKLCQKHFL
jgi:hypothetical protein